MSQMDRRKFLKWLGASGAAAAVVPLIRTGLVPEPVFEKDLYLSREPGPALDGVTFGKLPEVWKGPPVTGTVIDEVGSGQQEHLRNRTSIGTDDLMTMLIAADEMYDAQNVPAQDRWICVPPRLANLLRNESSVNGFEYPFKVYSDRHMPKGRSYYGYGEFPKVAFV